MARTPFLACLLLTAVLVAPGAAASHDDPDCRFTSNLEELTHIGCTVDVPLQHLTEAVEDFLGDAQAFADETREFATTVAGIVLFTACTTVQTVDPDDIHCQE